jgi:DNA (cytosine-5)-methyltransferase 1
MNLLSLFSGIDGFAKGFIDAGYKFDKHYTSEIDKYAKAITKYNFPESIELGNVSGVKGLKDIDIITFGFPCQDLSIDGKRKGFRGSRSSLFFEAIRIIQETKPRLFIFENVKGLFSSHGGKDFTTVLRTIADIGLYECEWQLVNTRWFLPQNRERIYFIGHLRGNGFRKVFPIGENDNGNYEGDNSEAQTNIAPTIDMRVGASTHRSPYINEGLNQLNDSKMQGYRVYSSDGDSATLQGLAGGVGAKTGLYKVHNMLPRSSTTGKGGTGHLTRDDGSVFNIDTGRTNGIETGSRIRRLTPTECERLQGFPDGFTAKGNFDGEIKEISDSQRYKVLGNAVTVNVVKEIAERLKL